MYLGIAALRIEDEYHALYIGENFLFVQEIVFPEVILRLI
jgi:hypothetical protein